MNDNKQNKNGYDKQHEARRQEVDLEFKEIWDRVQVSICHHLKKNRNIASKHMKQNIDQMKKIDILF